MNKDLIAKCKSIEKRFVKNKRLDYTTLINEVNKNSHFRTDKHHNDAINYFTLKGVILTKNNKISIVNFSIKECNALIKIRELAKNDKYIDISTINDLVSSDRIDIFIKYLKDIGYIVNYADISTNTDDNSASKDNLDEYSTYEDYIVNDYNEYDELDSTLDEYNESQYVRKFVLHKYDDNMMSQYFKDIEQYKLLSAEEEYKLTVEYAKTRNKDIRDILIKSNLRLVLYIAKHYVHSILPLIDIVQYGNIGLINAIDKFDPNKGCRLSTYANCWINQSILRGLSNDGRIIRLPVHAVDQAIKNKKSRKCLEEELGRSCSDKELADYINKHKLFVSKDFTKMTASTLRLYEDAFDCNIISLQLNVNVNNEDKDETSLESFVPSEELTPEEAIIKNSLKPIINDVIENVLTTEKEREVIRLRFGLDDDIPKTLEQVGNMFNVTRERIRQIETNAMRKIRHSRYAKAKLKDYLASTININ